VEDTQFGLKLGGQSIHPQFERQFPSRQPMPAQLPAPSMRPGAAFCFVAAARPKMNFYDRAVDAGHAYRHAGARRAARHRKPQ
jgi:hypothetical protein